VQLTSLRDGNHVIALLDGGNAVLLDRSGHLVTAELNIAKHGGVQTGIGKLGNRVDADRTLLVNLNSGDPGSCQYAFGSVRK